MCFFFLDPITISFINKSPYRFDQKSIKLVINQYAILVFYCLRIFIWNVYNYESRYVNNQKDVHLYKKNNNHEMPLLSHMEKRYCEECTLLWIPARMLQKETFNHFFFGGGGGSLQNVCSIALNDDSRCTCIMYNF